jgi:hypothetical protein
VIGYPPGQEALAVARRRRAHEVPPLGSWPFDVEHDHRAAERIERHAPHVESRVSPFGTESSTVTLRGAVAPS